MNSQFLKPKTLKDALQMKKEYPGSLFLGGGTEINNPASDNHADVLISLVDLNLKACVKGNHNFILGASTTFQELIDWEECYPTLKEAAGFLYSRNVRNMATIGGNIGFHTNSSYLVPLLMVLDAEVELGDDQVIPLAQYVKEDRTDLILNVRFVHDNPGSSAVKNMRRTVGGETIVSAAVSIVQLKGKITKAAIAVGGIFDRISRLTDVEEALVSGKLKSGEEIQNAVKNAVTAQDDYQGTASYKEYSCGVIVSDCVARCMKEGI